MMNNRKKMSPISVKYILSLFRLEANQAPIFPQSFLIFLWRVADFVPGRLGTTARWLIGHFRFKKIGEYPTIHSHNTFYDGRLTEIGDNFYSGKYNYYAGGPIKIGNNVSLANYVIIETTDHLFDDITKPIREQGMIRKEVVIEDDVWLGNRVTVLGGVTIGHGSVIGAGSVVTKDIPPNSVVVGNPAKVVRQRGFDKNGNALAKPQVPDPKGGNQN